MANKTQMRLAQITGSIGTGPGQINDNTASAQAINTNDLAGVLSHMASAIKRLHGGGSFQESSQGEIKMMDNQATGFMIKSLDNKEYLKFVTTDNSEAIQIKDDAIKLQIGTGQDLNLYHNGTDSYIENTTGLLRIDPKSGERGIELVADGAVKLFHDNNEKMLTTSTGIQVTGTVAADSVSLGDDEAITFGAATGGDVSIDYDESATDSLLIKAVQDGADFKMVMAADRYDDGGDAWQTSIAGGGTGKLIMGNDIASKGTFVEHFSITPNSTVGNSTAAFAGAVTIAGNLTVSGTTTTVDTTNLLVKDKLITLNDGGGANSGTATGIEIEENGSATGYIKTDGTGDWTFRGAGTAATNVLTLDVNATKTITVGGALNIEADSNINQDLSSDANVSFAQVTANGGLIADNITIDGTEIDLSSGDLTLDVAGDIIFNADGGDWKFHDGADDIGLITNFTAAGSKDFRIESKFGDLVLVPKLNKGILLGFQGGPEGVGFIDPADGSTFGFLTGSSSALILSGGEGNDLSFKVNNGGASVEVGRFDAGEAALFMGANRKVMFGDAGESISGDGTDMKIDASQHLHIDAGGAIILDGTTSGGPSIFMRDAGNAGTSLDFQPSNSGDWSIEVAAQDKDLIFKVDDNGSINEIARMVGADSVMRFPSNRQIQWNDANEAVYGDGSGLFLKSNNVALKMPTVAGTNGQVLQVDGAGNLSFINQSAGAVTSKKYWLTPTGSVPKGEMVGTLNNVNWSTYGGGNDKQLNLSEVAHADEGRVIDVYVNGMLMLSGSEADRAGGNADYHLINQAGVDRQNVDIKFAFDLEADDTVVLVQR